MLLKFCTDKLKVSITKEKSYENNNVDNYMYYVV